MWDLQATRRCRWGAFGGGAAVYFFFSEASAANGLAACISFSPADQVSSTGSLPGAIGTTGSASTSSSSTKVGRPQQAVLGHQQRFITRRQRGLVGLVADQAEPLHGLHREHEPLKAALAHQRQTRIDGQFDEGHLQNVLTELQREAAFAHCIC